MRPEFFEDCARQILRDPSRWIDPEEVFQRDQTTELRAGCRSETLLVEASLGNLPRALARRVVATRAGWEPTDKGVWSSAYFPPVKGDPMALRVAWKRGLVEAFPRESFGYRTDRDGRWYGSFQYGNLECLIHALSWFNLSLTRIRSIGPPRSPHDPDSADTLWRVSDGSTVIHHWRRPGFIPRDRSAFILKQATRWAVLAAESRSYFMARDEIRHQ